MRSVIASLLVGSAMTLAACGSGDLSVRKGPQAELPYSAEAAATSAAMRSPAPSTAAGIASCPGGPDVDALSKIARETGRPASCNDGGNTWTVTAPAS